MEEIFRNIPTYEGLYQVSNLGNVKSLSKYIIRGNSNYYTKEKILINKVDGGGYLFVCFCVNQNRKYFKVHKLVAMAFLNHIPDGTQKIVVDHINNDKNNNRLDNLQLLNQRQNSSKNHKNKTSKYVGVSFIRYNKWRASVTYKGKTVNLGEYNCETLAFTKYNNFLNKIKYENITECN
jgi:hypothetical protein